jgi:hypothetical protein
VTESKLGGNGAMLVRERAIARTVQTALERLYQIEEAPTVEPFVTLADDGQREALFFRQSEEGDLEIAVRLPPLRNHESSEKEGGLEIDSLCQIIEGVSHFVMIAERSRAERETTQLELEMQAEVDKYVVLATAIARPLGTLDIARSHRLRAQLYDDVLFSHGETTEIGIRYRLANSTAARFVRRLEREYVKTGRIHEMRGALRRFFSGGQEEKLRLAAA